MSSFYRRRGGSQACCVASCLGGGLCRCSLPPIVEEKELEDFYASARNKQISNEVRQEEERLEFELAERMITEAQLAHAESERLKKEAIASVAEVQKEVDSIIEDVKEREKATRLIKAELTALRIQLKKLDAQIQGLKEYIKSELYRDLTVTNTVTGEKLQITWNKDGVKGPAVWAAEHVT